MEDTDELMAPSPFSTSCSTDACSAALRFLQSTLTPGSKDFIENSVAQLLSACSRGHGNAYPFGNPVSIERRHLPRVTQTPYYLAEKTDGVRVALIFTRSGDGTYISVAMTRTGALFALPVVAKEPLFDGSVFDAELVCVDGGHVAHVLVFDVCMCDGSSAVAAASLPERLRVVAATFPSACVLDASSTSLAVAQEGLVISAHPRLYFMAKPMQRLSVAAVNSVVSDVQLLPHASDGFVLTPAHGMAPLPGTSWQVYKVKTRHTVDLLWRDRKLWFGVGADLFTLEAFHTYARTTPHVGHLRVAADACAELDAVASNTVVEMVPFWVPSADAHTSSDATVELRVFGVRKDRSVPNNVLCVARTLQSARDAVTMADILAALASPSSDVDA